MNENYDIEIINNTPVVSSRTIAKQLNKSHKNVLRGIENILLNEYSSNLSSIKKSEYKAINGKTNKQYLLTKDGFILYMFNIQGHNDFKIAYINEFNRMQEN